MKQLLLLVLALSMAACGSAHKKSVSDVSDVTTDNLSETIVTDSISEDEQTDPTGILYVGTFREVIDDGSDAQLSLWAWEDQLHIKLESFFEERMYAKGKINAEKAESVDSCGVKLPISLEVIDGGKVVANDDVLLTFKK